MIGKDMKRQVSQLALGLALVVSGVVSGCTGADVGNSGSGSNAPALQENGRVYSLIATAEGTARLRRAAAELNYTAGEDIPLNGLNLVMVRFDLPDDVTGAQAIAALEAADPASTVGVNHAYRLQNEPPANNRRNFANAMLKWPAGGCPALRPVGIIDGGVDENAPALSSARVTNRNFGSGSEQSRRHGTDVASVLADPSRLRNLRLYSANVISQDTTGQDAAGAAAIVQAIDWLTQQDVKLINVSLAGPRNKLLNLAVNNANSRGAILIAAAGNQGRTAPPQFPAAFSQVIAVTAVDAKKRAYRRAVRGAHIDIAAPGVDVFVSSGSGGRYVSGTSIAAPFVTASLAVMRGATPSALSSGSEDLGSQGKDQVFGHGLLQADSLCTLG
ncbi:S8 family serine peptidase [Pseudahrensia aquimaris]|uniref:S8 family serine peptidase n=1 Tax=Pseudahrensia aquimaris TaxID=744461 RepID=A0ABW3FIR8_9HYPH